MPQRPPSPCTTPGCPELVRDGSKCDKHRKKYERLRSRRRRRERKQGAPTYDDMRWRRFRKRYLSSVDWKCEDCGVRPVNPSKLHVHHLVELSDGGEKFDPDNCHACCRRCHNRRHPEKGG